MASRVGLSPLGKPPWQLEHRWPPCPNLWGVAQFSRFEGRVAPSEMLGSTSTDIVPYYTSNRARVPAKIM